MAMADFMRNMNEVSKANNKPSSGGSGDWDPTGSLLDLCRKTNRGTALLRIIPDTQGIPIRLVHGVYDIFEIVPVIDQATNAPMLNEDGSPRIRYQNTYICKASNYHGVQLTQEQQALLTQTIEALDKYFNLCAEEWIDPEETETSMSISFRPEITFFWAKLISLNTEASGVLNPDYKVRLIRHHSKSFYQDFSAACEDKSNIKRDGGAWMDQWINRNLGPSDKITSIKTTLDRGFKVSYAFEEGQPVEVTQEDLNACTDLYAAGIDVTHFDEQKHREILTRVTKYISEFENRNQQATGINVIPVASNQPQTFNQNQVNMVAPPQMPQMPQPPVQPQMSVPQGYPQQGMYQPQQVQGQVQVPPPPQLNV